MTTEKSNSKEQETISANVAAEQLNGDNGQPTPPAKKAKKVKTTTEAKPAKIKKAAVQKKRAVAAQSERIIQQALSR